VAFLCLGSVTQVSSDGRLAYRRHLRFVPIPELTPTGFFSPALLRGHRRCRQKNCAAALGFRRVLRILQSELAQASLRTAVVALRNVGSAEYFAYDGLYFDPLPRRITKQILIQVAELFLEVTVLGIARGVNVQSFN